VLDHPCIPKVHPIYDVLLVLFLSVKTQIEEYLVDQGGEGIFLEAVHQESHAPSATIPKIHLDLNTA